MSGVSTNRTNITLPPDVSKEIMQKAADTSVIMQFARKVNLPGRGTAVNVINGDPEAEWVGETAAKPVSNPSIGTKILRPYKLSVIVPFSNEFRRDVASLYDALIERLPGALGKKFDNTVIGGTSKPGDDFDNFASIATRGINGDTYAALVAADGTIAASGGVLDGFALAPQAKTILLGAVDGSKRPLFINNVAEGAIPMVLGARTLVGKGLYKSGTPNIVGVAGDWTQAMWGAVNDVEFRYSSDATIKIDAEHEINLFQQNMFAVICEIEVGFRADTNCFVKLTDAQNTISA